MVESTGLENRRCESIRGFESHSLRQLHIFSYLRKYPSGRRGSPAKGVGRQKRREGSNPSFRAKSRNRGTTTVPRFFLYSCRFAGFVLSTHRADFKPVVRTFGERITHKIYPPSSPVHRLQGFDLRCPVDQHTPVSSNTFETGVCSFLFEKSPVSLSPL